MDGFKVCIIGDNGSVHIQKWIKGISDYTNIKIHVITFDKGIKIPGVTYHYMKVRMGNKLDYFLNSFFVKNEIKKIKPDVVHSHYATSNGFLGAFSGFHPLVITGWGADIFDSPKGFWMRKILTYAFKKADAITVLSEITRKEANKYTDKEIQLIPFGVDLKKFPSRKENTDGIIRIGTIRTLSEKYGVEYLIRAFALLSKKYDNIRLEIVGDGPLRFALEKLTVELSVKNNVTFHGYVNQNSEQEKYISLLTSFDIFAILSIIDSETFGVAAIEASSCEIPVVATKVGGLPGVIESEKTGILVAPKNVEETVQALERLIVDVELRKTMGKNGRKNVEEKYDWKQNVNQMYLLYKSMLTNR